MLARATGVTLGPGGRTVLLDRMAGILATKDGVTVAREVDLPDRVAALGCSILKDACVKTSRDAGDGTTTTAVIAAALLRGGQRLISAGIDPWALARSLREAGGLAERLVRELAVPVEDQDLLERVALLASNGDESIACLLAEGAMAAGAEGTILIEDAYGVDDDLLVKEGMEVQKGAHPAFLPGGERTLEGALVAVVTDRLTSFEDVRAILEEGSQFGKHPILVLAEAVEAEALATMHLNNERGLVECAAVGVAAYRSDLILEDLAALAGATLVGRKAPLGFDHRAFQPEWFGSFRKVVLQSKKTTCTAQEDKRPALDQHIAMLQREAEVLTSDFDKDRHRERIAQLVGGLVLLRIGGVTEAARKERRARVEDALGAVRAALKGGVVPGGGVAYLLLSELLSKGQPDIGGRLLAEALRAPLARIAQNAGEDGRATLDRVERARGDGANWIGWDAVTGEVRDLMDDPPVIDPAPVVEQAVRSAVSAVSTLLTAEVVLTSSR